jgi:phosphotransferase system enzyme I (PtsP)
MPSGVALTEPVSPRSEVILQLMGVPAISEVGGAFRWASPGDVALLDADHGFFIINPSRAEVSRLRAWRKSAGPRGAHVEREEELLAVEDHDDV